MEANRKLCSILLLHGFFLTKDFLERFQVLKVVLN